MANQRQRTRRPVGGATDQVGEGPRDIDGLEASQLPDKGRGSVDTDRGKQLGRKPPGLTGGLGGDGDDVGLAGEPEVADIRDHGHRKHN